MKKFSWKAPAVYVAIGAIAGSLMAAPAAMAGQNFRPYWAKFSQNGEQPGSAQAILYGGTNYFGIYYLQQLLKKDGIDATWNGSELSLNGVPTQKTTTLSVSGSSQMNPTSPLLTNAITVNGVTYVPLAAVQAMLTHAGVRLNEGDHQQGSSGISVGKVQSIISHLKDAEQSLSQYVKTSMQAQMGKHVDQGDAKDAVHHLMDAMAKLQSAYAALTALEASVSATSTSSGMTVTGSVYGTNTGTLAQTLSTIASALQADFTTLNGVVMGSGPSFGNTVGLSNTGTSSGSTSATSDFASVVSDITTQIGQLYQVESQLQQSQVNSGSQDN